MIMDEQKLYEAVAEIRPIAEEGYQRAKARLDSLTKPLGSLGRLEELAQKLSAILKKEKPVLKNKAVFILAADHGVTQEGVSAYPSEVTPQMVINFLNGGAAINVLAAHAGARVVVADFGVAFDFPEMVGLVNCKIRKGTDNFSRTQAMNRIEAVQSIVKGMELVQAEYAKGLDLIGTGDMGIGNTASSSAIAAVYTGKSPAEVTGQGTGIAPDVLAKKVMVIERALSLHKPDPLDPIGTLAQIGGLEIGGIAGVILGGARLGVPVFLDGFISGAGALLAQALCPESVSYMVSSHRSAEPGHDAMLKKLELSPLLDLKMRLGEGTGAALGFTLADAACKIINEMATFAQAKVSGKRRLEGVPS